MSNLKTLKDIENKLYSHDDCLSYPNKECDELRQVAREWLKYLESEAQKTVTKYPQGKFQANWIKHFFNLEDE